MGKKRAYTGLRFNYKIDDKTFMFKIKTIEEFLETEFPKNNNPLSPTNNTIIYNIMWNMKKLKISNVTLKELKDYLSKGNIRYNKNPYERKETYDIETIREYFKDNPEEVNIDGDIIKNSIRYPIYLSHTKCEFCGLEGKFFAKEKFKDHHRYHLNFYAIDDGEEVQMTKHKIGNEYVVRCMDCMQKGIKCIADI